MPQEHTVKVHFIDGTERIVPAKDIQPVGDEGARRAAAIVDGKEVPIYKRSEPEWGPLWYEQEQRTEYEPPPGDDIESIEQHIQEINENEEDGDDGWAYINVLYRNREIIP